MKRLIQLSILGLLVAMLFVTGCQPQSETAQEEGLLDEQPQQPQEQEPMDEPTQPEEQAPQEPVEEPTQPEEQIN